MIVKGVKHGSQKTLIDEETGHVRAPKSFKSHASKVGNSIWEWLKDSWPDIVALGFLNLFGYVVCEYRKDKVRSLMVAAALQIPASCSKKVAGQIFRWQSGKPD